jgi:D-3-phosphoglycerate dehydrogenase
VPESLLAVARAGAGVNNVPVAEYSKLGIVVFNTPGANANAVKELVMAGMLLAARHPRPAWPTCSRSPT